MRPARIAILGTVLAIAACADQRAPSPPGMSRMAAMSGPVQLSAQLTGGAEVPPVGTQGGGNAQVTFDRAMRQLSWTVEYANLTGPATAAHFHGPANAGQNAPVTVNIVQGGPPASPIRGQAILTETQARQLLDGQWYLNLHTDAHKGGEIRGQVLVRP